MLLRRAASLVSSPGTTSGLRLSLQRMGYSVSVNSQRAPLLRTASRCCARGRLQPHSCARFMSAGAVGDGKHTHGNVEEDEEPLGNEEMEDYDDRDAPKTLDPEDNPELHTEHIQQQNSMMSKYMPTVVAWAPRVVGAGVIVYAMTKASLYITTNLMSITLTDAVWFGFASGFIGAGVSAATIFGFYQTFDSVRPEPVYKMAMEKLRNDPDVTSVLGPFGLQSVQSGFIRAYKLDGGSIGFGPGHRGFSVPTMFGAENKLVWRYPRIQMCFQVYGRDNQALCTVEAINKRGSTKLNFVALDILTSDSPEHEDPIIVYGKEERLYIRDQLTGFVRFKKNYLTDDVQRYPSRHPASSSSS